MARHSSGSDGDNLARRSAQTGKQWVAAGVSAGAPAVEFAVERGRTSARQRVARLRSKSWQVGQCAIAAAVAWYIAFDVLGHPRPFFAPVAAVVSLGTSYGQRLRRVGEVTIGVAVGVFVGDMLTHWLGIGGWQIALIVSLAMSAALLLDQGTLLVTQAAVQAVVVATLLPYPGAAFSRWTDALIGGGVALVAAAVVPRAPLRRPREQAAVIVRKVSDLLRAAAQSIRDGDVDRALAVLRDARSTDGLVVELRAAADEGLSVLASSPFRRRHKGRVRAMAELVEPLDFALRNTRVLVRRVAVACYRHEQIPDSHATLLDEVADCTDAIAGELAAERQATAVVERLIAVGEQTAHAPRSTELSAEVVLAQTRSLVADLLAVCGLDPVEAMEAIPLPDD